MPGVTGCFSLRGLSTQVFFSLTPSFCLLPFQRQITGGTENHKERREIPRGCQAGDQRPEENQREGQGEQVVSSQCTQSNVGLRMGIGELSPKVAEQSRKHLPVLTSHS